LGGHVEVEIDIATLGGRTVPGGAQPGVAAVHPFGTLVRELERHIVVEGHDEIVIVSGEFQGVEALKAVPVYRPTIRYRLGLVARMAAIH
jgi:hypothetical protein